MATNTTGSYRRASEFVEGIGPSIDAIQNRDVLLRSFEVSNRPMRGESAVFVSMTVSELADNGEADEEIKQYHAWSESLAEKLNQVGEANLPVIIKFTKQRTGSGFNVWTLE